MHRKTQGIAALTAALFLSAGLVASAQAAPTGSAFTIDPVAGTWNDNATLEGKVVGGGADAKATGNKEKGTYTLTKSAPTTTYAFAALRIQGLEGQSLSDLGTLQYDAVSDHVSSGSPRVNVVYDNDNDGNYDGYAMIGSLDTHRSVDLGDLANQPFASIVGQAPDADATLVRLSIIIDEQGTAAISNITLS